MLSAAALSLNIWNKLGSSIKATQPTLSVASAVDWLVSQLSDRTQVTQVG